MKRIVQVVLAVAAITAFASFASADPYSQETQHRNVRQHERIQQGERSGSLTRGEARRLRIGQRHVRRVERRSCSDGQMSRRECGHINRMQNRESRRIFRFKHNGRSA